MSTQTIVDIAGIDPMDLLEALWHRASPNKDEHEPNPQEEPLPFTFDRTSAYTLANETNWTFTKDTPLFTRLIPISLTSATVDPTAYDALYGPGTLQKVATTQTRTILGINRLDLLHALWERSSPAAFFRLHGLTPPGFERDQAQFEAGRTAWRCDYVLGRVIKLDLGREPVDPRGYERDNGEGAFGEVLAGLGGG